MSVHLNRFAPFLVMALLVMACGADVERPEPIGAPESPGTGALETPERITHVFDGRSALKLEAPEEVALGDPVPMRVSLENISRRTLTVYHGYPQFSFRISTADGESVWNWTAGRVFPLPLYTPELAPGEVWEFEHLWEQRHSDCDGPPTGVPCPGEQVEAGEYVVFGVFHGDVVDPSDSDNWTHRTEGHALRIAP